MTHREFVDRREGVKQGAPGFGGRVGGEVGVGTAHIKEPRQAKLNPEHMLGEHIA